MLRYIPGVICLLVVPVFISFCEKQDSFEEIKTQASTYIAHVQLDSTVLIATEVINGLEIPWDITIGPDGWIWINEQKGTVSRINPKTAEIHHLLDIPDLYFERSRGLLSKVIHPEFQEQPYVYLHYTYLGGESGDEPRSRIVRYTFRNDSLVNRKTILDNLPGSTGHNGSRMLITPDQKLWLGTGDAQRSDLAQDTVSYNGKVLRMNLDGSVPDDNPFDGSRIWTIGHRNIQGITFGNGKIYTSEHGPDTDDEVNLLLKEGNYGWPDVLGYCGSEREKEYCRDSDIVEPIYAWTPVIAPAGIEYYGHDAIPEWKNSLLLTSLRIQTLRVLHLDDSGENVDGIRIFFQQYFGRLRDVAVSPDGKIFLATSNMDWYKDFRPEIHDSLLVKNGDRIIMLQKADAGLLSHFRDVKNKIVITEDMVPLYLGDAEVTEEMNPGESLYLTYCSSCHGADGEGMEGYTPGLTGSERIAGNRDRLIDVLLNGISPRNNTDGSDFIWEMPAYRHLNDEEIASILNYIRSEFAGKTDRITTKEISTSR